MAWSDLRPYTGIYHPALGVLIHNTKAFLSLDKLTGIRLKVVDIYDNAESPQISYEIIPPKRGGSVTQILDVVEELMPFDPPFIDVTSHAAQAWYEELPDGSLRRHVKRKRPGTLGLCAI